MISETMQEYPPGRQWSVAENAIEPAISISVNSKSTLFRRKIEFPWIYPSPLNFPSYFETR